MIGCVLRGSGWLSAGTSHGPPARLGASRAMAHRLLHDLARGGCIEVSRERIVLLKKLPPRC